MQEAIKPREDPYCEDECQTDKNEPFEVKPWMFHLQAMVLEPEPLKYLEKFLEESKNT